MTRMDHWDYLYMTVNDCMTEALGTRIDSLVDEDKYDYFSDVAHTARLLGNAHLAQREDTDDRYRRTTLVQLARDQHDAQRLFGVAR